MNLMMIMALITLAGGLVFMFLLLTPSTGVSKQRLKRVTASEDEKDKVEEKISLMRERRDSSIPLFDQFLKSALPNVEKTRLHIARSGLKMTVSEYILIMAVTAFVAYLVLNLLVGMKLVLAVLLGGFLGYFIPHTFVGMKAKSRAKKFIKFFPESIDAMVRSIKSGLPIAEAVNVVASEMPDPVGEEFRNIRDGVRMGRSLEEAMWEVAKRLDVPEYRYLIIALSIQRETGGNLAETLYNVSEVLRKRRQIKLKIKAMSSEAKASAMILGALPFLVSGVLALVSGGYIGILVNDPRGQILTAIALSMMGMGVYIMMQMINFEI